MAGTPIHQNWLVYYSLFIGLFCLLLGMLLGWFIWEDNNVTPLEKPDCELRKGYYTVISVSNKGITNCGITKSIYHAQETQE